MAIFLDGNSKVLVQGITGSEGTKPEAAIKLLDLADSFESALKSTQSGAEVAALAVTAAPAGSL